MSDSARRRSDIGAGRGNAWRRLWAASGVLTVVGSQGSDQITLSLKAGSPTQLSVDMNGVVKSFNFSGVLLDARGRARIFEVTIIAAVTVRDQVENRVIYDNQNYVFRGEFEFACLIPGHYEKGMFGKIIVK